MVNHFGLAGSSLHFLLRIVVLFFLWAVAGLGVAFFGELVAGPEDAACEEVEVNILLHGLVVMTERGAKHTSLAVGVCPDAEVILLGVFAISLAKPLGVGPDFLDLVQFALRGFPLGREGFHDGVLGREVFDRDSAVPLVAVGGNAEQFAPLVRLGVAVAVHRTVDDRRGDAGVAVCLGDILDPVDIGHAAETFVVNDDVVRLGPVLLFVDGNLYVSVGTALVFDVEGDVRSSGDTLGDDAGLVAVVVAAAAGDDQRAERFGGTDGKAA